MLGRTIFQGRGLNHFHKIQGYADVLIANVRYLLSEGSGQVYFVTVTMRCRDADDREVGGSLHLACHAPVGKMKVYAAFTPTRLQNGQKPSVLPWQLVCSWADSGRWAEQGVRSSLVSACSDIEARAAEIFTIRGPAYVTIDDMGLLRHSDLFVQDVRDLPEAGCVDVAALLNQWAIEAAPNHHID
jgi:hypothetical protein